MFDEDGREWEGGGGGGEGAAGEKGAGREGESECFYFKLGSMYRHEGEGGMEIPLIHAVQ